MSIQRNLPQSVVTELERQTSEEAYLVFVSFFSENLHDAIRVVSDPENFVLDGNEYTGFQFEINLLSDDNSPPQAKLTIANVDERIGQAVLASTSPVSMNLEILPLSEFDMNTYPRQPLNPTPLRVYKATHLRLSDVTGDLMQITGTIKSWDYSQEPWPSLRATQNRFPALFWS